MRSFIKIDQVLKEQLSKRKITQSTLATNIQTNKSTLHGYLYGAIPSGVISIIKIAKYFDISVDELLFGEKGASRDRCTKFEERSQSKLISNKESACFQ